MRKEKITKNDKKVFLLWDTKLMNLHKLSVLRLRWNSFFKAGPQKENNVTENIIK